MMVNPVMTRETFSSLLMIFSRRCSSLLHGIWYIYFALWRELGIMWQYFSPPTHLAGCDAALNGICQTELLLTSNQYPWCFTLPTEASSGWIWIHVCWPDLEYCQHSPEICSVLYVEEETSDKNRLNDANQQYHPILHNERLLPDGILLPAGWD